MEAHRAPARRPCLWYVADLVTAHLIAAADPATTALSAAALAVAVLGLILSIASLTWQAATFVMSGARVRSTMRHGARSAAAVVSGLPGSQALERLAEQGFVEEVLGIEVINTGRLAVQVAGIKAALASGVKVSALAGTVGPDLPHRLEAQSTASWFLPAAPIRGAVRAAASIGKGSDPCDVWMEVELGNGKTVKTKERMLLSSR